MTEALSTFEVAADLLESDPAFIFNHNESVLYEWVLDYRPELFERIRRLVKAGRWHIAGGWYLQPDCNFPDGESFVRQILVGREFFRQHFGIRPEIAYNFDAFGHHANLPQILRLAGYRAYIHFRPGPKELDLPADLYRWRGIDGSEVLGYRPPSTWYGTDDFHELAKRIDQTIEALGKKPAVPAAIFWGMGDHGGGATRDDLKQLAGACAALPTLKQSTTAWLLKDLEAASATAPVHEGELQRCFTGCYTSVAPIKQANRRAESLAQQAERFATLAWWFAGVAYPREKMLRVWKDTLFNQFHDILPGSSTRKALQGAFEIAGRQHKNAREVIVQAQLDLAKAVFPRQPLSLLVFNPLPYPVKAPVDFEYMVGHRPVFDRAVKTRITRPDGKTLPSQEEMPGAVSTRFDWRKRAVFEAQLPALGYATFQIHLETRKPLAHPAQPGVVLHKGKSSWTFKNRHGTLTLDCRTGLVSALIHQGANLLREPGGRLLVFRDEADAWGTDVLHFKDGRGTFRLARPSEVPFITGQLQFKKLSPIRIVEQGPVRTLVEVIQVYRRSTAVIRYTIYRDRPEIETEVRLVWNEPRHLVKFSWPTIFAGERYRVEIPYGDIERPQDSGEQPNGRWILLGQPAGNALGIVSIGPGGHDVVQGDLRISLVRSAIYCHYNLHRLRTEIAHDFMDLGENRFRFALLPGSTATLRSRLPRLTERLSLPPTPLVHFPLGASAQAGAAPETDLIEVSGNGVELGAIKPAEREDALIVRLVERAGRPATAALTVAGRVDRWPVLLQPYEIVTLRIDRAGVICECNLLEEPLSLRASLDISSNGNGHREATVRGRLRTRVS